MQERLDALGAAKEPIERLPLQFQDQYETENKNLKGKLSLTASGSKLKASKIRAQTSRIVSSFKAQV